MALGDCRKGGGEDREDEAACVWVACAAEEEDADAAASMVAGSFCFRLCDGNMCGKWGRCDGRCLAGTRCLPSISTDGLS